MWRRYSGLKALFAGLMLSLVCVTARARDYEIVTVNAGATADVYFEINLSGKLYLRIVAPPGAEACADFWWIKWPFGNIQNVGRRCDSTQMDVPGLTDIAISAKLRVRAGGTPLKIVAAASEKVANTVSVSFP